LSLRGRKPAQRRLDDEHGNAMHRGPSQIFSAGTTHRGQNAGLGVSVQRNAQQLERSQAAFAGRI
jgi:hypothetical protein